MSSLQAMTSVCITTVIIWFYREVLASVLPLPQKNALKKVLYLIVKQVCFANANML